MTEAKQLCSFQTNIGSSDCGATCIRCYRKVVCASMNGAPFCRACLYAAADAISIALAESAVGPLP